MTSVRNKENVLIKTDVNGRNDINLADDAGLLGFQADLRIMANSTPHVSNMARLVVTRTPGWMDRHPDAARLKANFIHLIETHAESWTGFEIASTIGTAERAAGKDGQVMKAPTTRTVSPITPVASYKAIGEGVDINFWNYYMDTAIISPDQARPDFGELVSVPDTWTVADYTFDLAVWEPNSTFTRARWAMMIAGLWPSTPVPIALERNVQDTRKMREYSITFEGGVYDASQGAIDAASALEKALNVNRIKNSTKAAFFSDHATQIDTGIESGLLAEIKKWPGHTTSL